MDIQEVLTLVMNKDLYILNFLAYLYIGTSVLVFFFLVSGITAPYGRYARNGWGLFVNGKLAWFIQEIPSLAIPVVFVVMGAPMLNKAPNLLLFSLFVIHYIQR